MVEQLVAASEPEEADGGYEEGSSLGASPIEANGEGHQEAPDDSEVKDTFARGDDLPSHPSAGDEFFEPEVLIQVQGHDKDIGSDAGARAGERP